MCFVSNIIRGSLGFLHRLLNLFFLSRFGLGRSRHRRLGRTRLIAGKNVVNLIAVNRFPIQKSLGHAVHFLLMAFNEVSRTLVLFVENAADFGINLLHCLFRNVRGLRHRTAEEDLTLVFGIDHHAHLVAHAVTHHHIASKLRGTLKVIARPGRHLIHEHFFGNATAEEDGDAGKQIVAIVRVTVFFGQLHRHAERSRAG